MSFRVLARIQSATFSSKIMRIRTAWPRLSAPSSTNYSALKRSFSSMPYPLGIRTIKDFNLRSPSYCYTPHEISCIYLLYTEYFLSQSYGLEWHRRVIPSVGKAPSIEHYWSNCGQARLIQLVLQTRWNIRVAIIVCISRVPVSLSGSRPLGSV